MKGSRAVALLMLGSSFLGCHAAPEQPTPAPAVRPVPVRGGRMQLDDALALCSEVLR
ncbi:MAG TPA: hypothetical protein VM285_04390 [Polyangia bacterium]|nr:hypothetical protein [Polyangia bacterium]